MILAVRASLDSRHEVAEVQDFTSGIASALPSDPLMHLTQITHEGISDSSMFTSAAPPPPVFSPSHPSLSLCRPPACNCDPMGSISMQCHGNGTCHCRHGFVGYKCDKCELNYFHNRATHQCEECPVCYGLVKKQVSVCLFVTDVCGGSFKILLIEPSNLQLL